MAVWYLLMGRWTALAEIDEPLQVKVNKMLTRVGAKQLEQSGKSRQAWREEIYQRLKSGRVYQLDLNKKLTPACALSPT